MKLLCIDTSSNTESIALTQADQIVAELSAHRPKGHGSELLKDLMELLQQAAWQLSDIDGFAIGLGPGGFTSLRIGLATAKTLAFSLNKPIYGVSTLEVIQAAFSEENSMALIDAKRGEVYAPIPAVGMVCVAPSQLSDLLDDSTPWFFCGDGAVAYAEELRSMFPLAKVAIEDVRNQPNAAQMRHLINPQHSDTLSALQPLYIRPSDAELTYPDGFPDAVVQFKL